MLNIPVEIDYQVIDGEERFVVAGMTKLGRFLTIVWTDREGLVRIVTAFDSPLGRPGRVPARKGTIAMAMNRRVVPKFSSEAEEAEWWYRNRDMISRGLKEAAEAGELKVLTRERLRERLQASANSRNITIRMQEGDIERVRRLAEKKGIGYQTYMKILLREALDREDRKASIACRRSNTIKQ